MGKNRGKNWFYLFGREASGASVHFMPDFMRRFSFSFVFFLRNEIPIEWIFDVFCLLFYDKTISQLFFSIIELRLFYEKFKVSYVASSTQFQQLKFLHDISQFYVLATDELSWNLSLKDKRRTGIPNIVSFLAKLFSCNMSWTFCLIILLLIF